MPTKLPEDVEKHVEALRDPATPYDHVEHAGWLVMRLWESEDEYDVIAALVVGRVGMRPAETPESKPSVLHRRWRTRGST
jgi:hypothetical protein